MLGLGDWTDVSFSVSIGCKHGIRSCEKCLEAQEQELKSRTG